MCVQSEEDSTVVEEAVVRDAATVFPNETHAQEDVRVEELKQAIGASRFISESQVPLIIDSCMKELMKVG